VPRKLESALEELDLNAGTGGAAGAAACSARGNGAPRAAAWRSRSGGGAAPGCGPGRGWAFRPARLPFDRSPATPLLPAGAKLGETQEEAHQRERPAGAQAACWPLAAER
jgi:hypothetical protein